LGGNAAHPARKMAPPTVIHAATPSAKPGCARCPAGVLLSGQRRAERESSCTILLVATGALQWSGRCPSAVPLGRATAEGGGGYVVRDQIAHRVPRVEGRRRRGHRNVAIDVQITRLPHAQRAQTGRGTGQSNFDPTPSAAPHTLAADTTARSINERNCSAAGVVRPRFGTCTPIMLNSGAGGARLRGQGAPLHPLGW
jgi:hypothetical protein